MAVKELSLVKYAGEYWVTLADFTVTRDTEGYSDHASVKSAIRTFVVRHSPDKYIAFRGEQQIRNIIKENEGNDMFISEDLEGLTRTALIHWDMIDMLHKRFKVNKEYVTKFNVFMDKAQTAMSSEKVVEEEDTLGGRSTTIRYLRNELQKLDREIEARKHNREKILQALNALESLELNDL